MRVYVRSLLFLFLVAIKELRPEVKIEARNSLGSALFCEITNDIVLSNYDLKALEDYMKELAAKSDLLYLEGPYGIFFRSDAAGLRLFEAV